MGSRNSRSTLSVIFSGILETTEKRKKKKLRENENPWMVKGLFFIGPGLQN